MSRPATRITRALLCLLVVSPGCGGGGSPSGASSFPSIKGTYGAYLGLPLGATNQRWTAPDGSGTTRQCTAVTSIPVQNGAQFSGDVDRTAPCSARGTFTGEIAQDKSFRFTLTQERWESCTASGPVEYTGHLNLGNLVATGRATVRCDDGRTMTVDETITGALPTPPSTP